MTDILPDGHVFAGLPRNGAGVILCDPPWKFEAWSTPGDAAHGVPDYPTMHWSEIAKLPVADIAADDSVLFMWIVWPQMPEALKVMNAWGYSYKTCAFSWMKADARQIEMFRDDMDAYCGMGYWTRANSEVCLLGTSGSPKRINADVRQGIIEPRREHSRKPDIVYDRIERLLGDVPKVELFARTKRAGWQAWGNETEKFSPPVIAPEPISSLPLFHEPGETK